jgi:hypothetical protein
MAKRRWLRRMLGLGVVAGATYAVWRVVEANRVATNAEWEPQPFPFPPQPSAARVEPWVGPVGDACPASHPVKAKLTSRIFHVPGGSSYDRTIPDRCYADPATAEADGFRAAKR